tara:strand:+ start:7473 stop:11108 length:3636 start_codon:yes stop_codon:yes gene_type:complete
MDLNKIELNNGFRLIEASAGTGKSYTLAHIVLRNIIENKLQPENILLLSFTKNTCNDLRNKIIARINEFRNYCATKNNKIIDYTLINLHENYRKDKKTDLELISNLDHSISNINKILISTFHGFCHRILEEYDLELSTNLGSKVKNDLEDLYLSILDDLWIEDFYSINSEIIKSIDNKKIKTKYKDISKINKKFLSKILSEIDNENIYKFKEKEKENFNIDNYLIEYVNKHWKQFCRKWNEQGEDLFFHLKKLGKLIETKGYKSKVYSSKPKNKFKNITEWINEINKKIEQNNIEECIYQITKDDLLTKYFYSKSIKKELQKYLIEFDLSKFEELEESIYLIKDNFFNEFIRIFISKAYLKLKNLKAQLSILNYNDLIKNVEKNFLNDNYSENRSINFIRNKYKCILIDEFQDTDNIQWQIIKKLFKDNNHCLICVGDPKQAIYKFRGGDIETYLNAKKDSEKIYFLLDNYRSSKNLLNIINTFYSKGLLNSNINYIKLNSKSSDEYLPHYKKSYFEIIEFSNAEDNLENLVLNHLQYLLINNNDIEIDKIAILSLYNYQCEAFKILLSKNNLPYKILNKNNIFDTESSSILEILIKCLLKPHSIKNIILLITSKLIQCNDIDIDNLDNNQTIEDLKKKFYEWLPKIRERGFLNLVNELINEYASQAFINDNELRSQLFQLSEIIEKELIKNNYNLNNILFWFQNEVNKDTRKSKGEEFFIKDYINIKGINLSTIHASKGLEYDVVICPYLWDISKKALNSKGPIWKDDINKNFYINIEDNYSKVRKIKSFEDKDLINESERLIYVALTRAKYKLIIFNNINENNNILNNNLLINLPNKNKYILNKITKLEKTTINSLFKIYKMNQLEISPWRNKSADNIEKEREIKNPLLESYSRSSYSSWVNNNTNIKNEFIAYNDKFKTSFDIQEETKKERSNLLSEPNPLSEFPKGKKAGTCLHKIIERHDFYNNSSKDLSLIIKEELNNFDIDPSLLNKVKDGINRVINTPLGIELENKRLIDIPEKNVLKEVKYDLAMSNNGLGIKTEDIFKCFLLDKDYLFGKEYASKINELNIFGKGFHSGFIDCIIPIGNRIETSKWWIIDWKSNVIKNKNDLLCLPKNYSQENIINEMIRNHYPLQSHLYLLALHRLLKWRLKGYQPIKNLGGFVYIFLRGLPEITNNNIIPIKDPHPGIFVGRAPIRRINYLDKIFSHGS